MRVHRRFSLAGRVAVVCLANVFATIALFSIFQSWLGLNLLTSTALTLLVVMPITLISSWRALRHVNRTIEALTDGVRSFHDRDFSMRIAADPGSEIAELITLYNQVGDLLRDERNQLYQKELLLDTILQGAPMAVILTNAGDRVIYSNRFARDILASRLDSLHFDEVLENCPQPLREALQAPADGLVTLRTAEQEEVYHSSRRLFYLNTQRHTLYIVKRLTPELRRQEVAIWKKAIRLMNHELNNSLAPISSLVHSARLVTENPEHAHRREEIFAAIEERLVHLTHFLEGYAQFARLPLPRKREVDWNDVLTAIHPLSSFRVRQPLPATNGFFDPAQVEQALINLLKNAHESGSAPEDIEISIQQSNGAGTLVQVLDRGKGMTAEEMEQALLPFYSSKLTGTGLGLPLSSEIVEAHGGYVRLQSREGGGMAVSFWLPAR